MRLRPALLLSLFIGPTLLFVVLTTVEAQQAGKVHRVGLIFASSPVSHMTGADPANPAARAFVHELRALGYVEGHNLILEHRSAEGKAERLNEIVAELVRLQADVIVTVDNEMTRVAKALTTTVPIVMAAVSQPAQAGLVASLARPGGNVTGLTIDSGPENEGKRLEPLRAAVPGISRVAYLAIKTLWRGEFGESIRRAAQKGWAWN